MKIFLLTTLLFAFSAAVPEKRSGALVTSKCPTRQVCPTMKAICPAKTVLDRNEQGCCCHPSCKGRNEEYVCGCADKVCNGSQIFCKRCMDGCFCKNGFVRNVTGGKCIPEETCPAAVQ